MTDEKKNALWDSVKPLFALVATLAGIIFMFGDRIWIPRDTFEERMESIQAPLVKLEISINRLEGKLERVEEKICQPMPVIPSRTNGRRSP